MVALGHDLDDVAEAFDMAVTAVRNVIRSARATQVRDSSGHTGEASPSVSQTTGDVR